MEALHGSCLSPKQTISSTRPHQGCTGSTRRLCSVAVLMTVVLLGSLPVPLLSSTSSLEAAI
jgi:hypothetical protein